MIFSIQTHEDSISGPAQTLTSEKIRMNEARLV